MIIPSTREYTSWLSPVATSMSISIKTVEGAISRIYRKLDVRSRVELVRRTLG